MECSSGLQNSKEFDTYNATPPALEIESQCTIEYSIKLALLKLLLL